MEKLIISIAIGLVLSITVCCYAETTQNDIADSVIRLHIIANSDSEADQSVKLMIRDRIIGEMHERFSDITDPATALQQIAESLDEMEQIAQSTLLENGFSYGAAASLGPAAFPMKTYGNITLPAGTYTALRIELGEGAGQNWWCVMFPPLCFTDSVNGNLSDQGQDLLKSSLRPDEYDILTSSKNGEIPVQIRFKVVELWESLKQATGIF